MIVVIGSLNHDLVVPVDRLPVAGETILGGAYFGNPGGKGANQAVAAARLGQRVGMIGRVGDDDFGRSLVEALQRSGVDTSRVRSTPEAPTGVAFIQVTSAGENAIVVSPGANGSLAPDDVRAEAPMVENASVVLLQLEIPLQTVLAASELAHGTVVLNPAPAQKLPGELLENVDVLVPNLGELAELLDVEPPTTLEGVAEAARSIAGPRAVVVTLGAQGALLVTSDQTVHVPGAPVTAVDTTAAGDSFCGALADALARGQELAAATRWAVRVSALTVTRRGAQASLPMRSEVEGSDVDPVARAARTP